MPNASTHFWLGALVCAGAAWHSPKPANPETRFWTTLTAGLAGGTASLGPDWFDPPTSPRHRSAGHSPLLFGIGAVWLCSAMQPRTVAPPAPAVRRRRIGRVERVRRYRRRAIGVPVPPAARGIVQPSPIADADMGRTILKYVLLGYGIHLLADMTTPAGLPLV